MTGWGQLSHRTRTVLDRLAWGFGDLKRALVERGAWPASTVVSVASDGTHWLVTGAQVRLVSGNRRAVSLLVQASECLWGTLQLPDMLRSSIAGSVSEALWRVSPLPPEQVVAGWRAEPNLQGGWTVDWGICRRADVERALAQRELPANSSVYLLRDGCAIEVYASGQRKLEVRQKWVDRAAVGLVLFLFMAVTLPVLMPLMLKRQAVVMAVEHVRELEPKAAPLRQKLDDLRQQAALAEELRKNIDIDMPLASVVNGLSAAIPADTWLDRIEVNGREIRVTGLTSNATELVAHLARQPALADVRATAANVRDSALNKERFAFEMHWRAESAKP